MKANPLKWTLLLLLLNPAAAQQLGNADTTAPPAIATNQPATEIREFSDDDSVPGSPPAGTTGVALEEMRSKAEMGDAAAQSRLGCCYFFGLGVRADYAEALHWLRKAADQGFAVAQYNLGISYERGARDMGEAVKWYRKAAEQGHSKAQRKLGVCYYGGTGATNDFVEAVKWFRRASDQGDAWAQNYLGTCYLLGKGATKDVVEGVKWIRRAAQEGLSEAQYSLGTYYRNGDGVPVDYVEAYKWLSLASAQNHHGAKTYLLDIQRRMTPAQIAEAQSLTRGAGPRTLEPGAPEAGESTLRAKPIGSATGFCITEDGFLVTNDHVVSDATQIRVRTSAGLLAVKIVRVDAANDLALLKAEGKFSALPVAASRGVKLGGTVATVGFPNIGLQGFAPKLAKGEVASLSGPQDDVRYFQISVPVQPGNSGGALVDELGNVVGVVAAKLSASAALKATGALPKNVNYAIKSSYLLSFLESVPEVAAKLKEPNTKERKFEDVVKDAEQAAVLVIVY